MEKQKIPKEIKCIREEEKSGMQKKAKRDFSIRSLLFWQERKSQLVA